MTFAETAVTFDDGQINVGEFPEEIALRGFYPPRQDSDSNRMRGDVLPAKWLNTLIRDLYRRPASSAFDFRESKYAATNGEVVQGQAGYLKSGNGRIYFGIHRWDEDTTALPLTITYDVPFKAGTKPLVQILEPSAQWLWWQDWDASDHTKMVLWAKQPAGMAGTRPGDFTFFVVGEIDYADAIPAGTMDSFCLEPQNFYDGQKSFEPPTVDQVSVGLVPMYKDGANIITGDQLMAQALNYMLHDLFVQRAACMPRVEVDNTDVDHPSIVITLGDMMFQAWRAPINMPSSSTNNTSVEIMLPKVVDNKFIYLSGLSSAAPAGAAMAETDKRYVALQTYATNRIKAGSWVGQGDVTAKSGETNFLAIGKGAPESLSGNAAPRDPDVTPLTGFATADKTYPDGQTNRVKPTDAQMDRGFLPARKLANGATMRGDLVTANHLNWLFNDLYKSVALRDGWKTINTPAVPDDQSGILFAMESATMQAYYGRWIIDANTTTQGANTFLFTLPRAMATGSLPFVMMKHLQAQADGLLFSATNQSMNTPPLAASSVLVTVQSANNTPQGNLPLPAGTNIYTAYYFAIGKKP